MTRGHAEGGDAFFILTALFQQPIHIAHSPALSDSRESIVNEEKGPHWVRSIISPHHPVTSNRSNYSKLCDWHNMINQGLGDTRESFESLSREILTTVSFRGFSILLIPYPGFGNRTPTFWDENLPLYDTSNGSLQSISLAI